MPAFGKAKSHNWVEADNAFGDFDAIKVFQDSPQNVSISILEHLSYEHFHSGWFQCAQQEKEEQQQCYKNCQ